jgi:hypothetical protein
MQRGQTARLSLRVVNSCETRRQQCIDAHDGPLVCWTRIIEVNAACSLCQKRRVFHAAATAAGSFIPHEAGNPTRVTIGDSRQTPGARSAGSTAACADGQQTPRAALSPHSSPALTSPQRRQHSSFFICAFAFQAALSFSSWSLAAARLFLSTVAMSASCSPLRVLVTASGTVGSHILRALTSPAYKARITTALLVRDATLKASTAIQQREGTAS